LKQPTFGLGNTTEAFWHRASGRLSNRDNLLFDIINEPHDVKPEELARGMQKMLDRLAQRAPRTPVVVSGPDSDDNPYSEALFRTVKYSAMFPRQGLREQLARAGVRVSEVAAACGFESAAAVTHAFRAETGETPRACRARLLGAGAVVG